MKRGNFQVKFIFIHEDAMLYQIDVLFLLHFENEFI